MKTLSTNTNRSFRRRLGAGSLTVLLLAAAVATTAGAAQDQARAGTQTGMAGMVGMEGSRDDTPSGSREEPSGSYRHLSDTRNDFRNRPYYAGYYNMRTITPINGNAEAGEEKTRVCVACHGPGGNSEVPLFPQLAGQRPDYLYSRLRDFRAADEAIPYYVATLPMPQQARTMSDTELRDIAAYFAAQVPLATMPPADPSKVEEGKQLYMHGNTERGVPPCQGCHGTYGEGGPIGLGTQYMAYPILHGQHSVFLGERLRNFRDNGGWPRFSTDDKIMHAVALPMSNEDIDAVANYLASLPPNAAKKK